MTAAANTNEIAAARERLDDVRREVARVYVGSPRPIDTMLVALLARGHALLEGVPGRREDDARQGVRDGARLQRAAHPVHARPHAGRHHRHVRALAARRARSRSAPGPIFANVVLADEINRAPAKTQSALLEAMQERQVTIEGDRFELPAAVPRARDAEPHRPRGHLPAARGADRPLPRARLDGLPGAARRGADAQDSRQVEPPIAAARARRARCRAAAGHRRAHLRRGRSPRLRRRHHELHAQPSARRARAPVRARRSGSCRRRRPGR